MLRALHEVVSKGGANMSDASKQSVLGLIDDDTGERDGRQLPNFRAYGIYMSNSNLE